MIDSWSRFLPLLKKITKSAAEEGYLTIRVDVNIQESMSAHREQEPTIVRDENLLLEKRTSNQWSVREQP